MEILEIRALRGPNYFSRYRVIYMELDIGELEERPSDKIPGFKDRLQELIPSLHEHRCSRGYEGGFLERVEAGTWAGHIVEHVAIELQCLANMEVGFGKTLGTDEHGVYRLAYRYRDEDVGIQAGHYAVEVVGSLVEGEDVDIGSMVKHLKEIREDNILGPSTKSIVDEATARGIPYIRLNKHSYVQLGHGAHQRRIQATMADNTSAIGVEIADDKKRTKRILDEAGIPVPKGYTVTEVKEAFEIAERIGYPVVVKPLIGNHGRGITINVESKEDLEVAFAEAKKVCGRILIENFIDGFDHRILVINGKFLAAAKRSPPAVVGDGKSTIKELIDSFNEEPDRGIGHEKVLTRIAIDYQTKRLLRQNDLELSSVLPEKETFYLKSTANLSTGGIAVDVTDDVHPSIRLMAERIANLVGLNIIGIDFIIKDLKKPLTGDNGYVVEVNAAPGFRMHRDPFEGKPRDVASPVVDMLFPPGAPHSIPIIAVTGTNGKTTTVRLIAHILKYLKKSVGVACTDGIIIENDRVISGDYSGPVGAETVLKEPTVEAAVLEVARGGIIRRGLGYHESDVGVFLNIGRDHIDDHWIDSLEQLARLKGIIVETVKESGCAVLNADDPLVYPFKDEIKAESVLFSTDNDNPLLTEHTDNGGTVVTVKDEHVTIQKKSMDFPIAVIREIPLTLEGKAEFNVSNALAATAAAFAMGVKIDNIRAGLLSFNPSTGNLPGRMNILEVGNIKVVIDYGHNVPAIEAMSQMISQLGTGKKIGVNQGTGNRLDEDIIEFGKILAEVYDQIFINDSDPRGRSPGETSGLVKQGVLSTGFSENKVTMIEKEEESIGAALDAAQAGDLVVIQPSDVDSVIKQVLEFKKNYTDGS